MEITNAEAWGMAFIAVFILNAIFMAWWRVWRGNQISLSRIHGIEHEEMRFHRAGVARGAFLQHRRWATMPMRRNAFFKRWLVVFPGEIFSIAFSARIWKWCAPQFLLMAVAFLLLMRR